MASEAQRRYRQSIKGKAKRREYYQRTKEKHKFDATRWQRENPETREDARLRREYGISLEEYQWMLEVQDGVCAICRKPEVRICRLSVDHDHETGQVRGLLCAKCNSILGYAEDQPLILQAAIDYLGGK
jgi:hypothetical protein